MVASIRNPSLLWNGNIDTVSAVQGRLLADKPRIAVFIMLCLKVMSLLLTVWRVTLKIYIYCLTWNLNPVYTIQPVVKPVVSC